MNAAPRSKPQPRTHASLTRVDAHWQLLRCDLSTTLDSRCGRALYAHTPTDGRSSRRIAGGRAREQRAVRGDGGGDRCGPAARSSLRTGGVTCAQGEGGSGGGGACAREAAAGGGTGGGVQGQGGGCGGADCHGERGGRAEGGAVVCAAGGHREHGGPVSGVRPEPHARVTPLTAGCGTVRCPCFEPLAAAPSAARALNPHRL
eukprot:6511834-Prymnesium_polylepis.1